MAMSYGARVRRAGGDRRQGPPDREGDARGRGLPGPSLVIAYATASRTATTLCAGHASNRSSPSTRGLAALPLRPAPHRPPARRRSQLDSGAPKTPSRAYHAQREPLPHARGGRPQRATGASRPAGRQAERRPPVPAPLGLSYGVRRRRELAGGRRPNDHGPFDDAISACSSPHPLMPGSSPLADDLDTVRRLEDAGAAAIVMRSLFEEQIVGEELATTTPTRRERVLTPRRSRICPTRRSSRSARTSTSSSFRRIKAAGSMPVIASLNGTTTGELDRVRASDRAGGRRRPRGQRLRARDRSTRVRRGRRGPHGRRRHGRPRGGRDPDRRQALAVLLVARAPRAAPRRGRRRTAW